MSGKLSGEVLAASHAFRQDAGLPATQKGLASVVLPAVQPQQRSGGVTLEKRTQNFRDQKAPSPMRSSSSAEQI